MGPARVGSRVPAARGVRELITLDTSAIVALLDLADPDHSRSLEAFDADSGPALVPAPILSEVAYLVERDHGFRALEGFLLDLADGSFRFEPGQEDLHRVVELARRYDDLPLGFSDAAVIACAERHGGRVLTLDRRHFDVVGREVSLTVLP